MIRHLSLAALLGLAACQTANAPMPEPVLVAPDLRASRSYAGPQEFPPVNYAGYGILAFGAMPDMARGTLFCEAWLSTLLSSTTLGGMGVPDSEQMVTVWPIKDTSIATALNEGEIAQECQSAVAHYDFAISLEALTDARRAVPHGRRDTTLEGAGPFLLAWSPGSSKDSRDRVPVLVSDLSEVETSAEAIEAFTRWGVDIQQNPELWLDGWSVERIKLVIREWADRRGASVLSIIGVG